MKERVLREQAAKGQQPGLTIMQVGRSWQGGEGEGGRQVGMLAYHTAVWLWMGHAGGGGGYPCR